MVGHTTVSIQGVRSLGGHFACLCRGLEFYEVNFFFVIKAQEKLRECTHYLILDHIKS